MGLKWQLGEALVLTGTELQPLRYAEIVPGTLQLRFGQGEAAEAGGEADEASRGAGGERNDTSPPPLREAEDYIVDYKLGLIGRTALSRIADWRLHPLCGVARFDHRDFPEAGNAAYTVYADYCYEGRDGGRGHGSADGEASGNECRDGLAAGKASGYGDVLADGRGATVGNGPIAGPAVIFPMPRVAGVIASGGPLRIAVFGDSISRGAEASKPSHTFFNRVAARLAWRYSSVGVRVIERGVGGETSRHGLERLRRDVLEESPDLVAIGFGMNDQNRTESGDNAVPPQQYERNIRDMIEQIRRHTQADILLLTACLPNPAWIHASANAGEYAEVLRSLGRRYGVCVADVQALWLEELGAGKPQESLLLNNINHPNDYGHRLYARALEETIVRGIELAGPA